MIGLDQARKIMGGIAVSPDGDRLGRIGQIYLDDRTGQPEWATVSTGLLAGRESFVPLAHAEINGLELAVPYDKDTIKGAPDVDAEGGHLSEHEEVALYTHYGLDYAMADSDTGEDAMTRSQERLEVSTAPKPVPSTVPIDRKEPP